MTRLKHGWPGWMLALCLSGAMVHAEQPDVAAASPASGAEPQRHISGPDSRDAALIRQRPDAARWLQAGEERFAVMETAAGRADARGTVLIMAAAGQTAAQGLAGRFHEVLPALGWRVISLGLPPSPLAARTGVDAPVESAGDADDGESSSPAGGSEDVHANAITIDLATPEPSADEAQRFTAQARARIDAVAAVVQEGPPGPVVLIGIGLGAAPLTRYLATDEAFGDQSALVWIRPEFHGPGSAGESGLPAPWLGGERPWPILDITDSRLNPSQARSRRLAMQQLGGDASYRQDLLQLAADPDHHARQLGHRLHGWAREQFGLQP